MNRRKFCTALGAASLAIGASFLATGAARPEPQGPPGSEIPLSIARIYWEYNSSANDLGAHVSLDGEDWKTMQIENPKNRVIFEVVGKGPYKLLGMTELFFEGAEPSLDEFPLDELLALFPEGEYEMSGLTVDGEEIEGIGMLSHAIPDGPDVLAELSGPSMLRISWNHVTDTPDGFPDLPVNVVEYQVIVEKFQVTVPASVLSVLVTPEFVASLPAGEHQFEVLAIEESGNQTITEGSFVK